MRNIFIISKYTFKEALSRKVFLTFFGITTFMLLIFAVIFSTSNITDLVGAIKINSKVGDNVTNQLLNGIKLILITPLFGGGIFLSIFSASGFIPKMLEKGSIEIILSKPVSRAQLLIGKFAGVTSMVFANVAYGVLGFYLMFGIKFQIWNPEFLITALTITLAFCTLFSLIILIGILTRTSLPAMMLSYLIFFIFSPVLYGRAGLEMFYEGNVLPLIAEIFYYILPRTAELGELTTLYAGGGSIIDYSSIIHSVVYVILILSSSVIIFNKKDF